MKKLWDSKKIFNKTNLIVIIAVAVVIAVDMITKGLLDYKNIALIDGVISISWEHNTGAAWSIFSEHTIVLAIISAVFIVFFCLFDYFGNFQHKLYKFSFVLILGGTIGNMIDRFLFGYVRDFISADFLVSFPIFNLADSCLVVGVILLCVYFLFVYKDISKVESTGEVINESK